MNPASKKTASKIFSFVGIIALITTVGYFWTGGDFKTSMKDAEGSVNNHSSSHKSGAVDINFESEQVQQLLQSSDFQKMMKNEQFIKLMSTKNITEASKEPQFVEVLANPSYQELMKDPTFAEILKNDQFAQLEKRVNDQ